MNWESKVSSKSFRTIYNLPPSAKFILYVLNKKGATSRKDIIDETLLSSRTVGHALKLLLESKLIEKVKPSRDKPKSRIDNRIVKYRLTKNN
ncbi:MAG: MarR family transcriptional regulator [Candidatus Helarchaeota archaeon]